MRFYFWNKLKSWILLRGDIKQGRKSAHSRSSCSQSSWKWYVIICLCLYKCGDFLITTFFFFFFCIATWRPSTRHSSNTSIQCLHGFGCHGFLKSYRFFRLIVFTFTLVSFFYVAELPLSQLLTSLSRFEAPACRTVLVKLSFIMYNVFTICDCEAFCWQSVSYEQTLKKWSSLSVSFWNELLSFVYLHAS